MGPPEPDRPAGDGGTGPEGGPAGDGPVSFNHVGICVVDLERSRRFYEEVLGFRYWWELDVPDASAGPLLQLATPLGTRAVYLTSGRFVIELIHYAVAGTRPVSRG